MTRDKALETLRSDIALACGQLSLERLVVARNLVRCLLDEQDAELGARRYSNIRTVHTGSRPMPMVKGVSSCSAHERAEDETPFEAVAARRRDR